jgi:hypothetical protein
MRPTQWPILVMQRLTTTVESIMLAALIQMEDVLAINNVAGEEQEKHWKSLSVAEYIGEVPSSHTS